VSAFIFPASLPSSEWRANFVSLCVHASVQFPTLARRRAPAMLLINADREQRVALQVQHSRLVASRDPHVAERARAKNLVTGSMMT
jgi:uncharacterized protein YcaQ